MSDLTIPEGLEIIRRAQAIARADHDYNVRLMNDNAALRDKVSELERRLVRCRAPVAMAIASGGGKRRMKGRGR